MAGKLYSETTTFHGSGRREDLNRPHSCCWNAGSLFVTDALNNRIVQIWDIPREKHSLAHDPTSGVTPKHEIETDGRLYRTVGTSTTWMFPLGMASVPCYFKPERPGDEQRLGSLLVVCDSGHNRIKLVFVPALKEYRARRDNFSSGQVNKDVFSIEEPGTVLTLAGNGKKGMQNGPAAKATFNRPSAVCVAADGSLIIADAGNHCLRQISLRRPVPPREYKSPIHRHRTGSTARTSSDQRYNKMMQEFNESEKHGIKKENVMGALAEWAATGDLNCLPPGMELVVTTIAGGGTKEDRTRAAVHNIAVNGVHKDLGHVPFGPESTYHHEHEESFSSAAADTGKNNQRQAELSLAELLLANPENSLPEGTEIPVSTSGMRDGVGREVLFNNPVDLLLDRHGRIIIADQNNDSLRMAYRTMDAKWKVTTLKEQKLETATQTKTGHTTGEKALSETELLAPSGVLLLPASKWKTALFTRPSSLCHVDGRNLQEGLFLVSHKHAISLVAFDFVSELHDDATASRVSHFVLSGEEESIEKKRNSSISAHGYLDSEDVADSRYWNPRGLCTKPGMDVMVADASNCVIRQLSRGGISLAKAVAQVRTPHHIRGKHVRHHVTQRSPESSPSKSFAGKKLFKTPSKVEKSASRRSTLTSSSSRKSVSKAPTPLREKAKKSAKAEMGKSMGSILKRSYAQGGSNQGYLDDIKRILTAPPASQRRESIVKPQRRPSSSPGQHRRASTNTRQTPMEQLVNEAWKKRNGQTSDAYLHDVNNWKAIPETKNEHIHKKKAVETRFESGLRPDVHERDVIERKKERIRSIDKVKARIKQSQPRSSSGKQIVRTRRVTTLEASRSRTAASPRKYANQISSPHLLVAASPTAKNGCRRASVHFAGLKRLRRSKMEVIEARRTRERLRSMEAAKLPAQRRSILKKGEGRMSVSTHNASELAVHKFHPSMSRRSTALFENAV